MELPAIQHDTLATDEDGVLIPRNNILQAIAGPIDEIGGLPTD